MEIKDKVSASLYNKTAAYVTATQMGFKNLIPENLNDKLIEKKIVNFIYCLCDNEKKCVPIFIQFLYKYKKLVTLIHQKWKIKELEDVG